MLPRTYYSPEAKEVPGWPQLRLFSGTTFSSTPVSKFGSNLSRFGSLMGLFCLLRLDILPFLDLVVMLVVCPLINYIPPLSALSVVETQSGPAMHIDLQHRVLHTATVRDVMLGIENRVRTNR